MAFDGITIANLRWEFAHTIEGGKIAKIAQPEKDELLITIKITEKTTGCRSLQAQVFLLFILLQIIRPAPSLRLISVCF